MRSVSLFLASPMQYGVIALVLICSALVSQAHAYSQNASGVTVAADGSYTVCHNIPVPPSHAVVGMSTNEDCPLYTQYTVAPAQENLRICNLSETVGGAPWSMPFPADYVVTNIDHVEYMQSKCGGATSVYVIKHVADGINACMGSHIPDGWSYVRSSPSNGACESMQRNELHPAADGMRICSQSPYPANFVIGEVEAIAACGLQEQFVLRAVSDGVQACGPSKIPSGYVITATAMDSIRRCGEYQTLTLKTATDGIVVCTNSPIPSRYVIAATVPYNRCEDWTEGYQLKYLP